ncbi:MAG TPA: DUF1592 domain-containing protein, partial [Polyangiaceae bacterium]|nr:DUF1592 domain-containing protein [Polyangiaceae bacterium]
ATAGTSPSEEVSGGSGGRATDPAPSRGGETSVASGGVAGGASIPPADVNRVALHRLNNAEYDNTVADLLGVSSKPGAGFIDDEKLAGFDNIAAALAMSDARYEQYFNAADSLVEQAFADDALRRRVLTCTPADAAQETDCARTILKAFAKRAYRRPIRDAELDRMLGLVSAARALGEDFTGAVKNAVKALLSSADFLYRVELDADPASVTPHPLSAHELASRLSYSLWRTMPDATLFQRADDGTLLQDSVLSAQLDRLLSDSRAQRFAEAFAGQWLGLRALRSHQVDAATFPEWNEPLRAAMVDEGLQYFSEFLVGKRPMTEFLTADVNFVNGPLAKLYGFSPPSGDKLVSVTNTSDQRRGFLGLASFLTLSSFAQRTAPTLRGKWVLENLLCSPTPAPPPNVPELDTGGAANASSENIRDRLEQHRKNPTCAGCHKVLDPMGLGLENFDAIGRFRDHYANGDAVDPSGMLPTGEAFAGLVELSGLVTKDERLLDCAAQKMMTYALSREVVESDAAYLRDIEAQWANDGMGLAALLKRIVLSDAFRLRRGEP